MRASQHPTTDLYFWNSCQKWVRTWCRRGAIRRLGANTFASGDRLLLLRRDKPKVMQAAIAWPGLVTYLIDDDIDAAAETISLPDDYQHRLMHFADGDYRALLARADVVVASSDVLADQLARDHSLRHKVRRLDPYWDAPAADDSHFRANAMTLKMVHLGSASHSGGLQAVTPAVLRLLDETPRLQFSYVSRSGLHPLLERHDRVRRLSPMRWPHYRRWLARQRFHLAIYPLEQTRFDRARSANKLLEHCLVGAVGVYPRNWSPAAALGPGAILAPPDPSRWYNDLRDAVSDPEALRHRMQEAAGALAPHFTPSTQRQFWRNVFNLAT
jgi:hypothetical protein